LSAAEAAVAWIWAAAVGPEAIYLAQRCLYREAIRFLWVLEDLGHREETRLEKEFMPVKLSLFHTHTPYPLKMDRIPQFLVPE
jgi:hypothetical protein